MESPEQTDVPPPGKKKRGPRKGEGGRPSIHLDAGQVERLAALDCTARDIAVVFGVSEDTLRRRYAAAVRRGHTQARVSLHTWQMRAAKRGNAALLIFLGKNMLGQRDQPQIEPGEEGALEALLREFRKQHAAMEATLNDEEGRNTEGREKAQ